MAAPTMDEPYRTVPVTVEEPWGNGKRLVSGKHSDYTYRVSDDVHLCDFGVHLDKRTGTEGKNVVITCIGGTTDHNDHVYLKLFLTNKEGTSLCHVPNMVINSHGGWDAIPFGPLEIPGGQPHNGKAFVCEGYYPPSLYPLIAGIKVYAYE